MIRYFSLLLLIMVVCFSTALATPSTDISSDFFKTYGGGGWDAGKSVQTTSDGGAVIVGYTAGYGAGGKDIWLIKTDSLGAMVWNRLFGGKWDDAGYAVAITGDSGFAIAGVSGDPADHRGVIRLLKTDTSGNLQWENNYGSGVGYGLSVANDNGYFIIGESDSSGATLSDMRVIRTDSTGRELWSRRYGGDGYDGGNAIVATPDGGAIAVGYTTSFGQGQSDLWILQLDSAGDTIRSTTMGTVGNDAGFGVELTADEGFVVVGTKRDVVNYKDRVWVIKWAESGKIEWEVVTGIHNGRLSNWSQGYSIKQAQDGGYVIGGISEDAPPVGKCHLLIKLTASGEYRWESVRGGATGESRCAIALDSWQGIYNVGGEVSWSVSSDVNLAYYSKYGAQIWSYHFGNGVNDQCVQFSRTNDGGYVLTGTNGSNPDGYWYAYVVKTDRLGQVEWERRYGNRYSDGIAIQQLDNGNYLFYYNQIIDFFHANLPGHTEMYVSVLDSKGAILSNRLISLNTNYVNYMLKRGNAIIIKNNDYGYSSAVDVYNADQDRWHTVLLRLNAIGDTLWSREFSDTINKYPMNFTINGLTQNHENGYILASLWTYELDSQGNYKRRLNRGCSRITKDRTGGYYGAVARTWSYDIMRLDSLGDTLWFRRYSLGVPDPAVNGLACDKENNLYVVGSTPQGGMFIEKYSEDGVSVKREEDFPEFLSSTVCQIMLTESGFTLAGTVDIRNDQRQELFLAMLDANGHFTGTPSELHHPFVPDDLTLHTPYPNPFNSSTRIAYDLPAGGMVSLTVYDLSGREVAWLVEGDMPAGRHSAVWEAGNVPAGVYLVKLSNKDITTVRKVVLLK